jgi:hypothetical protein
MNRKGEIIGFKIPEAWKISSCYEIIQTTENKKPIT